MRAFLMITSSVFCLSIFYAQPNKLVTGYGYLRDGELDKAKENIDAASVHEKTKNRAKTWAYKGQVYLQIGLSTNEEYKKLEEYPFEIMFESYKKGKEIGGSEWEMFEKDANSHILLGSNMAFNQGVEAYNNKDYKKAIRKFKTSIDLKSSNGIVDSLAFYNLALAQDENGDADDAIESYKKCIEINYQVEDCYQNILYIYLAEGKDPNKLVNEALAKFPNSPIIISGYTNYLLRSGDYINAKKQVEKLLQIQPNSYNYHYTLGVINQQLADNIEAVNNYNQAIKLNPDYFDAYYNLGALYFNEGVELNNLISDSDFDETKLEKLNQELNGKFKKSITYLEKAHQLEPNDRNTMFSLVQIYSKLEMTEKYEEMKAKLD